MIFFAHCKFAPNQSERREQLKKEHVGHILRERNALVYGGVVGHYEAICFYVQANHRQDAEALVRRDPYAPLYEKVEIAEFQQRIPEPHPEFFQQLYRQLTQAEAASGPAATTSVEPRNQR